MKFSWTKCPHCQKTLNFNVEGGGGTVQDFGKPTIYKCNNCSATLTNGMKEWEELGFLGKAKAILRSIYTVLFYGSATAGIISAIGMYSLGLNEDQLIKLLIFLSSLSLSGYGYFYYHQLTKEIKESKARSGTKT